MEGLNARRRQGLATLTAGAMLMVPGVRGAQAQGSGRVSRILVGFPPGQATDTVARMIAEALTQALGQSVIVENRPGQGGSMALGALANAPADGSMMSMSALAAYCVNPHLYSKVAYDTLKDFDPVGSVADLPLALVVNPGVPVNSVKELIAYAKANPGKLSHPSSGYGTLSHLLMDDFKRRAGLDMLHVPYPGSAPAMNDLLAGTVQVGLDTVAVTLPHVKAGKFRLLAVGTLQRMAALPDTPTIAESGFPGFEAVAWIGLVVPHGTPLAWRQKVNEATRAALGSAELQQRLFTLGAIARPSTVEQFGTHIRNEYARWGKIVKESGTKLD